MTPHGTVPYWVRVTVANRVASTGPAWHTAFYKYNSGTYNNQSVHAPRVEARAALATLAVPCDQ